MNPEDGILIYLSLWRRIPSYTTDILRYPQLFLYIYKIAREREGIPSPGAPRQRNPFGGAMRQGLITEINNLCKECSPQELIDRRIPLEEL